MTDDLTISQIKIHYSLKMKFIRLINYFSRFHTCSICGIKWQCENPINLVCKNELHIKYCKDHWLDRQLQGINDNKPTERKKE